MKYQQTHQHGHTWNNIQREIPEDVIYYKYKSKYPHYGTGKMGSILNLYFYLNENIQHGLFEDHLLIIFKTILSIV